MKIKFMSSKPFIISVKTKLFLIFILLLMTLVIIDVPLDKQTNINKYKTSNDLINNDKMIKCDKWIVITAFNPPTSFIIDLEKVVEDWNIVVIGNNETNDIQWDQFISSNKLVYLSFQKQNYLNYSVIKYLKPNSYYRKIIGYLYAIKHGAKEIYEIDEDIEFNASSHLVKNFDNVFVSYGIKNDSSMINPYFHFGEKNIWPRGFPINNIGKQFNQEFQIVNSSNINLEPMVFQGLINYNPDIDSIFYLTRKKFNNSFVFNNSQQYPLFYFPNNYVPINSKNTRYKYCIFPFLMFQISLDEYLSDIWRGYIIQYFAWRMKGAIIYYSSDSYRRNKIYNNFNFEKEKKNYYDLNIYLDILKSISDGAKNKSSLELLNYFLEVLLDKNFLEKKDIAAYQEYLKDLFYIGYNFSNCMCNGIEENFKNYLSINSELKFYKPSNIYIIKNKNLQLIYHIFSEKIYNDILLIVNYNSEGFLKLNEYIRFLYKKFFPNIIFIYPSKTNASNTISCEESKKGYYSYKCFIKVYFKYPEYRGYLYINDDLFLKVWELSDLNFDIPWFYAYKSLSRKWFHYSHCYSIYNLFKNNAIWKYNMIQFNGYFDVLSGLADFYYLPNDYALKISNILQKMFNSRIFLECAIPSSMAILLSSKYQIIYIEALWGNKRKEVIKFLYTKFDQITIHPVKFSNKTTKNKVSQYIYFINAIEF